MPQKPEDTSFDFERTCIHVVLKEGQGRRELGNAVLEFLAPGRHIDEAAPMRVNEAEMWVAVTICKGLRCCEMRASFYAEGPLACAVDLQCLGGDEPFFLWVFQSAKRHLKMRGWGVVLGSESGVEESEGGATRRPRGEVAARVHVPETEELQADSAVVLARIAQDPLERGHMVSDAQVLGKVQKLVKSDLLEVAWPTACLLEALERVEPKPEVLASFLEGLRREELQAKVDSEYTEAAVQNLLRRVFFREDRD